MLLFSVFCFSACNCDNDNSDSQTFTAQFIIDGKTYCTESYVLKDKITEVVPDTPNGYVFKGWYMDTDYTIKWNFDNDFITADTKFYGYYVAVEEEKFDILYYDGEKLLKSDKVLKNDKAEQFIPEDKKGYEFLGWYIGEAEFDFNAPITDDITLKAKYELAVYHIKFIADGKIISDVGYTVEDLTVVEPAVPEKTYYKGAWNEYVLNLTDIEVKANYTPIVYKAEYLIDNEIYKVIEFSIEDTITPPEIPERSGFTGEWIGEAELGKTTQITVNYTPIVYKVTFVADNKTVEVITYTVLNSQITPPAVPPKPGYSGTWQAKDYELEDVTINAVYEPITYYATFIADGKTIATEKFDVNNMKITAPKVPLSTKEGYTAKWQLFELKLQDITINLIYEPITYTASFYADKILQGTTKFTVEDKTLTPPPIPQKVGYNSAWQTFEIQAKDITVNAVYTPITYYITFISDNSQIKVPYTVENRNIAEPKPTPRKDYDVKWQEYSITTGDMVVNAIYTPIIVDDEFDYAENQDGTFTVTGYHGSETELRIPATHNGMPVKSVGKLAFNCSKITKIELSYGIEIIEEEAFLQCDKLVNVTLPASLKKIGKYAFAFSSVEEIVIPNSVTEIGDQTFAHTPIKTAKLSDNLTELKNIFYYCAELNSVNLGSGLQTIKSGAFEGCNKLVSIRIPESVTIIEPNAFKSSGIELIEFEDKDNWYTCSTEELIDLQPVSYEKLSDSSVAGRLVIAQSAKYWYHKKEL